MNKPVSLQTCVAIALFQWVMLVVAQAQNVGFSRLGWLPLMQMQNALVAALMLGIAWVAVRAVWSRWLSIVGYAALTVLVVVSPGYFRMFGDHPRLSLGEGGMTVVPSQLLGSVGAVVAAAWRRPREGDERVEWAGVLCPVAAHRKHGRSDDADNAARSARDDGELVPHPA